MKILHIISGLNSGGAERMLLKLLHEFRDRDFQSLVISLSGPGRLGRSIEEVGVPVLALDFRKALGLPHQFYQLVRAIRIFQPDLVQTWMYHADLIGGLAARLAGVRNILWNIRQSTIDLRFLGWRNYWTVRTCAMLSRRLPRACLINSRMAMAEHTRIGYSGPVFRYVPNGFDIQHFVPSIEARRSVRNELGLDDDTLLVGLIARFDPQKDHAGFINAMVNCLKVHPDLHVLLAGQGASLDNDELAAAMEKSGHQNRFHLLGFREDIPRLTAALDIACSASRYGEGFPNAVGEAMACGISCVVTDVGDCREIVGDSSLAVEAGDVEGFSRAVLKLIAIGAEERRRLGALGRERVASRYTLAAVADKYEDLYREFAS